MEIDVIAAIATCQILRSGYVAGNALILIH